MSPQLTFSVSNYWPSQTNNVRPSPSSHQGRTIKKVMEGKGERPGCGGGGGGRGGAFRITKEKKKRIRTWDLQMKKNMHGEER